MSNFEYPRLSRSDILSVLLESQIAAVTDKDLRTPTPDFVFDIYARLLIHLDLLHEEEQGQMAFTALEQLENPDHHVDSVRIMNLYVKIKELIEMVDCPWKFTLKDLIRPQGDRTEYFLSAILNFILHKDAKMNLLRPIVEELTLYDEQRKDWEAKIAELNAEIAEYNAARERELPLVQEVDAKVKELHQTIAALNNQQSSLRASHRKLKDKTNEIAEEITTADFDLQASIQENEILRSKIVQSPDKLQRALEEKKLVREEARNAERSAMQSFQEKSDILEVYTKTLKKVSKLLTQMQSIHEQVNSAKAIERDYKALKAKLSDDGVLDKSQDAKLVEKQVKAQQLDELKKLLEKERDVKWEEAAKEYNSVKMEVESKRRDLEARQRKVEALVAEAEAMDLKTNLVKESGSAKVQELVRKSEEIVEQFRLYKNSVGTVLQSM